MKGQILAAALVAVSLTGCVSTETQNQAITFAFGAPPSADTVQRAVPAYFENVLIDPFSAHYQYGQPYKAWLKAGLIQGGGVAWEGWAVDVRVNAKNRMGGYTGWSDYHVAFVGQTVVNAYPIEAADVMWHPLGQ